MWQDSCHTRKMHGCVCAFVCLSACQCVYLFVCLQGFNYSRQARHQEMWLISIRICWISLVHTRFYQIINKTLFHSLISLSIRFFFPRIYVKLCIRNRFVTKNSRKNFVFSTFGFQKKSLGGYWALRPSLTFGLERKRHFLSPLLLPFQPYVWSFT